MRGKINLTFRSVRMSAVVEAALAAVRPTADAKGVALEYRRTAASDEISGDADRLQQIVWNLLSNAIKFTPRDGRVTVRMEQHDGELTLTVTDTGQGISQDFLPHVFDRFSQADSGSTRAHGGLGLGLAIVRHLVELHAGTVEASSAGAGQGATLLGETAYQELQSRNRRRRSRSRRCATAAARRRFDTGRRRRAGLARSAGRTPAAVWRADQDRWRPPRRRSPRLPIRRRKSCSATSACRRLTALS